MSLSLKSAVKHPQLKSRYNQLGRFYHNWEHVESVLKELNTLLALDKVKVNAEEAEALQWATGFHDVHMKKSDSGLSPEQYSAATAITELGKLPPTTLLLIKDLILSTEYGSGYVGITPLSAYFTDADLSILGSDPKIYARYINKIRDEYITYHGTKVFDYVNGRLVFLEKFLALNIAGKVFKTPAGISLYQAKTTQNLKVEIAALKAYKTTYMS